MSEIYTGTLPVDIEKNINQLIYNYKIFGTEEGIGEQTENLFDKDATNTNNGYLANKYLNSAGNAVSSTNWDVSEYIPVDAGIKYTHFSGVYDSMYICFYTNAKTYISGVLINSAILVVTIPENASFTRISVRKSSRNTVMFICGEYAARPSYIPHGYQIPLMVESGETENLLPFAEAGTFAIGSSAQVVSDGNGHFTFSGTVGKSIESAVIKFNHPITFPVSKDTGGTGVLYVGNTAVNSNFYMTFTDEQDAEIGSLKLDPVWRISTAYTALSGSTVYGIKFRTTGSAEAGSVTGITASPMLINNDASLTEYIPYYRYATDYNLYIGSTKLGVGDYVDYEEQKIYKRGENIGDWNKAKGYYTTITSIQNGVTISSTTGATAYPCANFTTQAASAVDSLGLTPGVTYLVTFNVSNVSTSSADTAKKRLCLRDSANTVVKSDTQLLTEEGKHAFIFTFQSGHYLSFLLSRSSTSQQTTLTITDLKITEFQSINPPAPFPIIPLETGLNTISSSISDLNVELTIQTGEISQVKLDNQIHNLVDMEFYPMIADEYDNTLTYRIGDYCIHDYQLYRCIFPISDPTDWNEIYWEKVTLADEITEEQKLDNELTDWEIIMGIINGTFSGINGYYENQLSEIAPGKFTYCSNLQEISLPNISVIRADTFRGCTGLTTINTSQVTTIGTQTFRDCSSLSSYNGAECISIYSSAFQNCTSLQTVSFPKCTTLNASAFQYCTSLQSISLPLCTTIGTRAFYSCYSLAEVNLPECTAIASYTFVSCHSLSQISLPKVKTLGSYAFTNCSTLSVLSLPLCSRIGSSGIINCIHLESLYLLSTTRCVLSNNNFANTPFKDETLLGHYGSIYVPASLVSSYKAATNWSVIADRITAYTE